MPTSPGPVKVTAGGPVLALIVLTAAVWVLRGYLWPTLGNVEVDALRAMLDPTLFQRDFSVQESLHFSPRYYYNALILLPARAGLPLEWAFVFWHLLALGILLSGLRALARTVGLREIAAAILVLWLLTTSVGTLGNVYFYTHAPVPAVWAGAAVVWGAALAWRGNWWAAFICFGAAAMLQFLVGFYAGVLALPTLLWTRRLRGLPLLAPWLLGLALVYVPMYLSGGTGSDALDNNTFVFIYAQLRLPHHLMPSTWGWAYWVQAVAFYAGAGYLVYRTRKGRPPGEQALLLSVIGLTAVILALNYLFVEIYPLALAAKLQPARITPLSQGITLLLLATRVQMRFAQRDWLGGIALSLIPFSLFPGLLLLLAAVLLPVEGVKPPALWPRLALALAVLLAFQPFDASMATRIVRYGLWGAILGTQLLAFGLVNRPRLLAGLAVLTVAGTAACAHVSRTASWPIMLAVHFSIDAPPTDPPGILGLRSGARLPKDALVLVPPTSEAWSFKLYARRAVIVDDKGTPFSDRGLREWRDRMEQILGTAFVPGINPAAAWRARSPESLIATAGRYGARYVLTRQDWHAGLPGRLIDHESGWSLWEIPEMGDPPALPPK